MTYVALATDQFDDVTAFYGERLSFPVVDRWNRPNARGVVFDLDGMRLEILDNRREQDPLLIGAPGGRVHIVVEVPDIENARQRIDGPAPEIQSTSWGARLFQVLDPDGVPVVFLQRIHEPLAPGKITARLETGAGQGRHFTRMEWARRQFVDKLAIDPFPGTANLAITDPESETSWQRIRTRPGVRIEHPDKGPDACDARCYPVTIEGRLDGAIVIPEVPGYSSGRIELIASLSIRETLGVKDGDPLVVEIKPT